MARPKKDIDEDVVADLASKGARNSEIAAVLGVDDETIKNRFSRILNKKRAERRIGLRDMQTQQAMQGNAAMLIWLGKNELEQADKQDVQVTGKRAVEVKILRRDDAARKPKPVRTDA